MTIPWKRGPKTDHVPIVTHLNLQIPKKIETEFYDFCMTEWKDFRDELVIRLEDIPAPANITTEAQLSKAIGDLTELSKT